MRIELTGPPTSGKSSLFNALRLSKMSTGAEKHGRIKDIPKKWVEFADWIIDVYKNTSYRELPSKTLRALSAAYEGDRHKGPMVFDELLILSGFSMAIRIPDKAEYYFRHVPLPSLLVYLYADEKILIKRNKARGDRDRTEKTLRCIKAHNEFMPVLKERGCRILGIDTGNINTPQIVRMIKGMI